MNRLQDNPRGCLLGMAVGDALGAAVEFQQPGTFEPVTGYRAGGPHGLGPGEWTDDTSMALALADSIATTGWDGERELDDEKFVMRVILRRAIKLVLRIMSKE